MRRAQHRSTLRTPPSLLPLRPIPSLPSPACNRSYHGDLNETVCVGSVDEDGRRLIHVTHESLMKAIAACKPGTRYRDIGDIITKHATANGCAGGTGLPAMDLWRACRTVS